MVCEFFSKSSKVLLNIPFTKIKKDDTALGNQLIRVSVLLTRVSVLLTHVRMLLTRVGMLLTRVGMLITRVGMLITSIFICNPEFTLI